MWSAEGKCLVSTSEDTSSVESDVRKAGVGDKRFEFPFRVIVIHVSTSGGGEHHFRMREGLSGGLCGVPKSALFAPLAQKQALDFATHSKLADTALRFGRGQPVAGCHIRQVLTDMEDAFFKIYIFPS